MHEKYSIKFHLFYEKKFFSINNGRDNHISNAIKMDRYENYIISLNKL